MAKPKGRFVVLEGLDGAGTTTQAKRLAARLAAAGHAAHPTAQPSSGPIGTQIRQILTGRLRGRTGGPFDRRALALLFAADRLDHLDAVVRPAVDEGRIVVSDRYVLSSLAYQGLDADPSWIAAINREAPAPDLTLFLKVRPRVALARRHADTGATELFETLPLQERVSRNYDAALRKHGKAQQVVVLDGEQPPDAVEEAIWQAVSRILPRPRRPAGA